ncbi:MAG: DUF433 domain-containing protein [Cytophagales bacterium]|nr:DUF433 domain-containing protein [Cytophagales bacterium]
MRLNSKHPYIVNDPGISKGSPIISGTRIRVIDIAIEYDKLGLTPDQIIDAHPHLNLEQIHGALSYYYENISYFKKKIREEKETIKKIIKKHPSIIKEFVD